MNKSMPAVNVPGEVRARAVSELLPELLVAYRSMLRMLKIICDKVATGDMPAAQAAHILTPLAWHVDRAVALFSGEGETPISYEELIKKAKKEVSKASSVTT